MPEPAEKAAAGLMSVVVFTAITALAIMVMLTVMGMLVTSLILTTWPGRRKCHALRMPAKRRRIIVISPGIRSREPEPQSHEGYEWLYVLNGRLRLVLGEHDLVLTPGEAAEFDTRVPHWFGAADAKPVEFLSLFGRQGERAHLRARPRQGNSPQEEEPDE